MILKFFRFLFIFNIICASVLYAYPANYAQLQNDEFKVPKSLRSRVDFWKDIFTKYGKGQFVIHHREYPQIIFSIIDLSDDYNRMSEVEFAKYKKNIERHEVEVVREAIEDLSQSEQPKDQLQKSIASKMQYLGPGTAKYKKILDEDLIRTQTGIKEKYIDSVRRAGRYLPILEKVFVEEYGLPKELTRIPFIESSFDYSAYSSVGAAGIWQFMPKTGRLYMTVNKLVDERRDPIESSRAAAKYLRSAYERLNSWPLAVTSYNHGVAGVANKVSKCGTSDIFELIEYSGDKPFGFASANFYPEFLAAVEIYESYDKYFPGLRVESPIRAKEIMIDRPVSASYVATQYGASLDSLQAINFALSNPIWDGRAKIPAGYSLKVPDEKELHVHLRSEEEPKIRASFAEPVQTVSSSTIYGGLTYKVRRGDTLISIAKKYGTSVSDLKEFNNISSNALTVGKVLVVKQKENAPVKGNKNDKVNKLNQAERIKTREKENREKENGEKENVKDEKNHNKLESYKVKSGDSLWSLSIKFGVKVDELKKINKSTIVGNKLTGGQVIQIPKK